MLEVFLKIEYENWKKKNNQIRITEICKIRKPKIKMRNFEK